MVDAFVAEQMYEQISTIVEEEHQDKKRILIEEAKDLARQMRELASELENNAKNGLKSTFSASLTEIENKKDILIERFAKDLETYTEKVSKKTGEVEETASKVLKEIEKKKGEKGEKGKKGDSGKDGSPDTGKQIVEKVNTEKESIEMATIKGLLKTIEELKRAIRAKEKGSGAGSGGMGNIQHETKDVSSATTTITTNYAISQNGYGIIGAYYQGQLIMRGEHYTVGGDRKTLTLVFTPQDSTKIDIVYVRG